MSCVVFAGPSGVGKSTMISRLMKQHPESFAFSVSHTTRSPRPGEKDGVHYRFVSCAEFEALEAEDGFLETTLYAGNRYGTSKRAVLEASSGGRTCVLDLDVAGVRSVKRSDIPCRCVFLLPPSVAELERRLVERGESGESIRKRILAAQEEMPCATDHNLFDSVVVNDDLEDAYSAIEAFFFSL